MYIKYKRKECNRVQEVICKKQNKRAFFFKKKREFSMVLFYDLVADGCCLENPVSTTLITSSSALFQLILVSSLKFSGPRALSKKSTNTTAKFCQDVKRRKKNAWIERESRL
jgi:hypothetical protein